MEKQGSFVPKFKQLLSGTQNLTCTVEQGPSWSLYKDVWLSQRMRFALEAAWPSLLGSVGTAF